MNGAWKELDRVLRGERTKLVDLRQGTVPISATPLVTIAITLAVLSGMCVGSFALWRESGPGWLQFAATTVKTPLLFLLTLLVTFPSLYVFNALVGSRLGIAAIFRLLMASLGVLLAVLASLGPIVAFFGASTTSYLFMVLLNVVAFTVAGLFGMKFLLETLHRLTLSFSSRETPAENPVLAEGASPEKPGDLDRVEGAMGDETRAIFVVWIIVFGLVGGQMSWILRPFIGDPDVPFTWLRPRGSSFFEGVWLSLMGFLGV